MIADSNIPTSTVIQSGESAFTDLPFTHSDPYPSSLSPDLMSLQSPQELLAGQSSQLKGGIAVYLSRQILMQAFTHSVLPLLAVPYEHKTVSEENSTVASMKIGIRKTITRVDMKLNRYDIVFLPATRDKYGQIKLSIMDEKVQGTIVVHVEKDNPLFSGMSDLINKDYTIDYTLTLRKMTSFVEIRSDPSGIPQIELALDVEDLDLVKDLQYKIANPDMITSVIDFIKSFWLQKVNKEIRKSIIPKVNMQITKIVNTKIKEAYKTELDLPGDLHLRANLRLEAFSINKEFIRLVLNGHLANNLYLNKLPQGCKPPPPHKCTELEDLSNDLQDDRVYMQISECVLQSAVLAYFQNSLNWHIDLSGRMMMKGLEVDHQPHYEMTMNFLKTPAGTPELRHLTLQPVADFGVTVQQRLIPDVSMGAKASVKVSDIELLGLKEDNKVHYKFRVHDIQVLQVYNSAMEPLGFLNVDIMGLAERVKDSLSNYSMEKEIAVDKVKIGKDYSIVPAKLFCFEHSFLFKAILVFEPKTK